MTVTGVAVVGAGVIAATHLKVVQARPDTELVAVVDPVTSAAEALADAAVAAGGRRPAVFASLQEALTGTDIGLVAITTPSFTHADLALTALDAGCHVVVEKPVDTDLVRGRRLLARTAQAAEKGQVVSVMTQNRFAPAVTAVREAIDKGRFGQLTSATGTLAWWRDDAYYASAGWRGTWEFDGGGALMNQGVHTVDVMLSLLGRPVTVSGVARMVGHSDLLVEDVAAAIVTFESGAVATLLATTAAFPENSTRIQVHGTKGSAYLQDGMLEFFHADDAHPGDAPRSWGRAGDQAAREVEAVDLLPDRGQPFPLSDSSVAHARQYEDVFDAIRTGRTPAASVEDGVLALAVITAVYVSSVLGRPVAVADVLAGEHDDVPFRVDHRQMNTPSGE